MGSAWTVSLPQGSEGIGTGVTQEGQGGPLRRPSYQLPLTSCRTEGSQKEGRLPPLLCEG